MRSMLLQELKNEPVTNLTFYDILAAANCLSQMEGKTPIYYIDPEFKTHFRNMHIALCTKKETGRVVFPKPKIFVKWDADGHRLPTASEWQAAAGKVTDAKITDGTQPVGQGKPNANGLYNVAGNARELVWTYGNIFDPETHNMQSTMGGDFHGPGDAFAADRAASPYGDIPFDGNHNIGLRFVCRTAGLKAPPARKTLPSEIHADETAPPLISIFHFSVPEAASSA